MAFIEMFSRVHPAFTRRIPSVIPALPLRYNAAITQENSRKTAGKQLEKSGMMLDINDLIFSLKLSSKGKTVTGY